MAGNPPVYKIRCGRVDAAVWEKEGTRGKWYSVTFQVRYKKKDSNEWSTTTYFNRDDSLFVAAAAQLAYQWIHEQEKRDWGQQSSTPDSGREKYESKEPW